MLAIFVGFGVLACHLMPRAIVWSAEAKKSACAENRAVINAAVERWYHMKGSWPDGKLSDIGADPEYFPDGLPVCPVDGSRYELHPLKHSVHGHGH